MAGREEDQASEEPPRMPVVGSARTRLRALGKTLPDPNLGGHHADGPFGAEGESTGPYQLIGEIARGGMGTVYQAYDPDLDREVAVKILLESHRDQPAVVRRFWEEARIGGLLQHPGTVPIYAVGVDTRFRPFFAMKLVRGRTLAQLLSEREDPAASPERLLVIFEQVCQTVAYAHARKIIHRDLKPSNVMVGEFGEAQVMDWGLAKRLAGAPETIDGTAQSPTADVDTDADMATYPPSSPGGIRPIDPTVSSHGSVLGTPAYMPPEQARGELDRLDERSDAFALGAILCEILTGLPPYSGQSTTEILRKAHQSDLGDCLRRLDKSGADPELISLVRRCLASAREDRPQDARAIAEAMALHRDRVRERLRQAELARASALARADGERKRRRLTITLMAAMIALLVVAGAGAGRWAWRVHAHTRRAEGALGEAASLVHAARDQPADSPRWEAARAAVDRAEAMLDDLTPADLSPRAADLRGQLEAASAASARAARDHEILDLLAEIRAGQEDAGPKRSDEAYARAFARLGVAADASEEARDANARSLRSRPMAARMKLIAALDDWAGVRWARDEGGSSWTHPLSLAKWSDDDPYRNAIREAMMGRDPVARADLLRGLARDQRASSLPAASAVLLARALRTSGDIREAVDVLRSAAHREPGDVWVNYDLARTLMAMTPPRHGEALRYYSAARALRPETAHLLAHLLEEMGRPGEGEEILADLAHRRPDNIRNALCYARALRARGDGAAAREAFLQAVINGRRRLEGHPDDPEAHLLLGIALRESGDPSAAIPVLRGTIRMRPDDPEAYDELASALEDRGDPVGAVPPLREAIRLRPDDPDLNYNLGVVLSEGGDPEGAIASYREAIRLRPDFAEAHCNLGQLLRDLGRYGEALDELRRGHAIGMQGTGWDYPSERWVQQAERLAALERRLSAFLGGQEQPRDARERIDLAEICSRSGRPADAARFYTEAFATEPSLADGEDDRPRNAAAFAAARASADPALGDAARAGLRGQALDWLGAELAMRQEQLRKPNGDKGKREAARALGRWLADPALAPLRDPEALAALPDKERAAWRAFWNQVGALGVGPAAGGTGPRG